MGRLKSNKDLLDKQVVGEAGLPPAPPLRPKEAWPKVDATHVTPRVSSPVHEPANPEPPPALAPPPLVLATPPHCIQGSLRKADFQHNGEQQLAAASLR